MKNTILKGICQTLILMLSLFLASIVIIQMTIQFDELFGSDVAPTALEQELPDEGGIIPADAVEEAPSEPAADDSKEYYPTLKETITMKVIEDPGFFGLSFFVLFLLIALYLILAAWPLKERSRKARALVLVNAGLYLGCGAPFLIAGYTETAVTVMTILYSAILAAESVIRIKRNHRPFHVVFRVVLFLVMALYLYLFRSIPLFVLVLIALRSVEQILRISFSQIRMDVLRKIIRKTYASEILLGMILLMVAFSLLLSLLDENIGSFGDALWFCFATVTTIGYGDVTTTSGIGRVLSVILGIYGIIVVALITSIIVNFYYEMKDEKTEE